MYIRYEAPTFRPEAPLPVGQVGAPVPAKPCASVARRQHFALECCPAAGRVGAPLPAKPCASVARRQHFTLRLGRTPAELAPRCRQSLMPPLRGANILPWSAAGNRPSWRLGAGKALCLRYGAPTFYPENRPGIAHVGARLPAKPYASVTGRQHFALECGPAAGRVGAPLPAKPCASVTGRQHFTLRLGRQPAKFALGCPQSQ